MNLNFQIVVPFYNDYENFLKFVEIISNHDIPNDTFLIVDNGSDNNDIIEFDKKIEQKEKCWKIEKSEKNLGFGGGIKFGAQHTDKDYIAWMPGNLKLNPIDVFELCKKFKTNEINVLLKANRTGRPASDTLKTRIFGIVVSLFFGLNLNDAGGTPNMTHSKFFKRIKEIPDDFKFDVFVLYYFRKNNLKVIRPKINYTKRLHGSSHWQTGILPEIKLLLDVLNSRKKWNKICQINIDDN